MKTGLWRGCFAFLSLFLFVAGLRADGTQVVYDNTTTVVTNVIYRFTQEHGDEISLAGFARQVETFTFRYYAEIGNRTDVTYRVRFYQNDGQLFPTSGGKGAPKPNSLLWESGPIQAVNGTVEATLPVPDVVVPDTFTWTVLFNGVTGNVGDSFSLVLANPPTVGAQLEQGRIGSYYDFWTRFNGDWALNNFGFKDADPKANFYARVEAVPEPGTWALALLGCLGVWLARRRRAVGR